MSVETKAQSSFWNDVWDIGKIIVEALVLALLVRMFLFQPFNIPSSSMERTLLIGDYIFVSKYSYGYSRYSFLFDWPPFSGRIWAGQPKRGQVVVFRQPKNEQVDYIKRVIGLPGDEIQMRDGVPYVNGKPLAHTTLGPWDADPTKRLIEETNPDGRKYTVLDEGDKDSDNTAAFQVPAGHYFVMGDNRDNSADSRFAARQGGSGVGFVPIDNFIGEAQIVFFSHDENFRIWQPWGWPWHIRWERIGKLVH